jgi:pyrroloquinoline quinone biosynthesis protein B
MGSFLRDNGPWSQLVRLENIELQTFPENGEVRLTPQITLQPLWVPHRDEYSDTVGIRITGPHKKLLYIPDIQNWTIWKRDIREELQDIDVALLDGTFFSPEELPGRNLSRIGHPFIKDSMDLLQSTLEKGRTRILFTHLNHSNPALDPEGQAYREIKNRGFSLAREGQEIGL